MLQELGITRQYIISVVVACFVIGPLLAFGLYTWNSRSPDRSNKDLEQAVTRYFDEQAGEGALPKITVDNSAHTKPYWYTVEYHFGDDSDNKQVVLVGDFEASADKLVVVTDPSVGFRRDNISGLGVPYDVVTDVTHKLEESPHPSESEGN